MKKKQKLFLAIASSIIFLIALYLFRGNYDSKRILVLIGLFLVSIAYFVSAFKKEQPQ